MTDAHLLLQLDLDRLLVVAEQAGEGGGEGFALLGAGRLARGFLALALYGEVRVSFGWRRNVFGLTILGGGEED